MTENQRFNTKTGRWEEARPLPFYGLWWRVRHPIQALKWLWQELAAEREEGS